MCHQNLLYEFQGSRLSQVPRQRGTLKLAFVLVIAGMSLITLLAVDRVKIVEDRPSRLKEPKADRLIEIFRDEFPGTEF